MLVKLLYPLIEDAISRRANIYLNVTYKVTATVNVYSVTIVEFFHGNFFNL